MKNIISLFLILSCSFLVNAQTKVFKTYEEYTNGGGEKFDADYVDFLMGDRVHNIMKFKNSEGNIVKYKTDNIWGFLFKGKLFRSFGKREIAMLMDSGKVNFYINGYAAIRQFFHPTTQTIPLPLSRDEVTCFLSVGDLNAKLYMMPVTSYFKLDYNDFKSDFPFLEELCECFDFKGNITKIPGKIRECVVDFNATNKRKFK